MSFCIKNVLKTYQQSRKYFMRGFLQTQPNIMEDQRHNYLAEVRALRTREAGYGNPGRAWHPFESWDLWLVSSSNWADADRFRGTGDGESLDGQRLSPHFVRLYPTILLLPVHLCFFALFTLIIIFAPQHALYLKWNFLRWTYEIINRFGLNRELVSLVYHFYDRFINE